MSHPSPEALAAFIDGKLDAEARAEVVEHIETCDDCLMIVAETSRLLDEAGPGVPSRRPPQWLLVAASVAAIAAIAFISAWLMRDRFVEPDPLARLASASRLLRSRPVEARLHTFEYAPLSSRGSDDTDLQLLRLYGVAGEVLEEHDGARDNAARQHAAGIAALLTGHAAQAVALLNRAVELAPNDAAAWNDLAAAHYESARKASDPQELLDALVAADHALQINPHFPDARFNRALILEAMNLREDAAAAYDAYLALDHNSGWEKEARSRLRSLRAKSQSRGWEDEKTVLEQAALRSDAVTVRRIVDAYRHDARAHGELILLDQWARALEKRNESEASQRLRIADAIGAALYSVCGERMLVDAVKAIEAANNGSRDALADAHRSYYDARILYSSGRSADSNPLFERAAARFHEGGSAMEAVARYYISSCLYDANRSREALALVHELRANANAEHVALRAQLFWNEATILARDGYMHEVLRSQRESISLFDRIGERKLAEITSASIAATESVLGRRSEAWRAWSSLFARTSESKNRDAEKIAIELAARTEALARRWDRAHSLLTLALATPSLIGAWRTSNALIWRALAANRLSWDDDASRSISEARRIALTVPDAVERVAATDMVLFASGIVAGDRDPARAAELLERYIEGATARQDRLFLAEAYVGRAKALGKLRQDDAALADALRAIDWLRERREHSEGQAYRDAFFATADAAVRTAVDLLERQGDTARAFQVFEQSRLARPVASEPTPAPGVVVIEYLALDDRLLIFVRTTEAKRLARVVVARTALRASIDAWIDSLVRGAETANGGQQLAVWLLDPVAELSRARHVVIVPDSDLLRLPFAALPYRTREPFIASMPLAMAPDILTATASAADVTSPTALVVGDPAFDRSAHAGLSRLPHAAAEAAEVAAICGTTALIGEQATRAAFLRNLANATLLHLATHAVIAANDAETSSILLAASDTDSGALYVRELQALHLSKLRTAVLTSCRTAATIDSGGDPSSVALAFLRAGATNVIASTWDVDDAIGGRVGLEFHRALQAHLSPATALRDVQLAMVHSPDPVLRAPRAWAGFRVYGSGL